MPQRILLIDDDPLVLDGLMTAFRAMSQYEVFGARDGIEGLEQVETFGPDCIIVDVRMPHLDGLQFLLALRGDPRMTHIPVVILSAMQQDDDILKGNLTGADRYLIKPQRPAHLFAIIDEVMALTEADRLARMRALAEGE